MQISHRKHRTTRFRKPLEYLNKIESNKTPTKRPDHNVIAPRSRHIVYVNKIISIRNSIRCEKKNQRTSKSARSAKSKTIHKKSTHNHTELANYPQRQSTEQHSRVPKAQNGTAGGIVPLVLRDLAVLGGRLVTLFSGKQVR